MPGHACSAQFTATSMIGMIALAASSCATPSCCRLHQRAGCAGMDFQEA